MKSIVKAKERHESRLMATPGVTGVGIGEAEGKPCIVILVEQQTREVAAIPPTLDGFAVVLQDTGPIHAQFGVE